MPKPDYSVSSRAIGRTLRTWRSERGLSLRAVEQASRGALEPVSFDYVSRLERGGLMPSIPKLVSLAAVYGRSVTELIDLYEVEELRRLVPRKAGYETLKRLAIESLEKGEITKALACFLGALDVARAQSAPPQQLASAHNNVGHTLNKSGRYHTAIRYLEEGLRIAKEGPTKVRLLDNLACAHYQLDNLEIAMMLAEKASALAGDDRALRGNSFATRSMVLLDLKDYAEAEALMRKAIEAYAEIGDETSEIRQLYNLGHCLVLKGETEEGLTTLRLAAARAAERGDPSLRSRSLGYFGRCLFKVGRSEEAKGPLLSSLRIARDNDLRNEAFLAAFYLWQIAEQDGARAEAREFLEIARVHRLRVEQRSEEVQEFDSKGLAKRGPGRPAKSRSHELAWS